MGIDNLKKAIGFVADFIDQVKNTKKINLFSILGFISDIKQVKSILDSWPTIVAEFHDLDEREIQELHQYIIDEFKIPEEQVDDFVKEILQWFTTTTSLVSKDITVVTPVNSAGKL